MKHKITRREFVQKSASSLAALSVIGGLSSCGEKQEKQVTLLPKRILGKTGLNISTLVFGGGSQFLKNKDGEWEPMMQRALDMGINLFDTSSNYKWGSNLSSEERFGIFLSPIRSQVLISTKIETRDPDKGMQEFETSLERMKTDYVDMLLIHSIEPIEDVAALESGLYKRVVALKDQGAAKFIGFSSMNSAEKSKEVLEKLDIDVCILAMNPTKYGKFAEVALPAARERNVGVIAMKLIRDVIGKDATAQELIHYALSQDGVAGACIGHVGMETLEENAAIIQQVASQKMTAVAQLELEARLAHLSGPHALCWARADYFDGMMA